MDNSIRGRPRLAIVVAALHVPDESEWFLTSSRGCMRPLLTPSGRGTLDRSPGFHDDLQCVLPLEVIDFGPVDRVYLGGEGPALIEGDAFDPHSAVGEPQARVPLSDQALSGDHEGAFENGRRKTLAPDAHRELPREAQRQLVGSELAVGFNRFAQGGRRQPLPRDALELRD